MVFRWDLRSVAMGNKLGRRRHVIDEKYTRPQGLYEHRDVDHKKLRKLILDSKLAPCYPGDDECAFDLEECPICFLVGSTNNTSALIDIITAVVVDFQLLPRLSVKFMASRIPSPVSHWCPFCKTSNYAVEYRGARTKEERGMEQIEEQKVIEAKIRMQRQQELQDEEEIILKRQEIMSSSRSVTPEEVEHQDIASSSLAGLVALLKPLLTSFTLEAEQLIVTPFLNLSLECREDGFDMDLEEIMVMEAIWLSIQDHGTCRNPSIDEAASSEPGTPEERYFTRAATLPESSPSGGLACAIAALAERQHMDGDTSAHCSQNVPAVGMFPQSSILRAVGNSRTHECWNEVSSDSEMRVPGEERESAADDGSEVAEAGTSYASSDTAVEAGAGMPNCQNSGDHFRPPIAGAILPDSFEEQMMLAMAVSLAEARAKQNPQGLAWN
ncbi:hypothetical protein ACLOJK_010833 [Asimina triloba]